MNNYNDRFGTIRRLAELTGYLKLFSAAVAGTGLIKGMDTIAGSAFFVYVLSDIANHYFTNARLPDMEMIEQTRLGLEQKISELEAQK